MNRAEWNRHGKRDAVLALIRRDLHRIHVLAESRSRNPFQGYTFSSIAFNAEQCIIRLRTLDTEIKRLELGLGPSTPPPEQPPLQLTLEQLEPENDCAVFRAVGVIVRRLEQAYELSLVDIVREVGGEQIDFEISLSANELTRLNDAYRALRETCHD